MINTCFDCQYRNIQEVAHEDIECHCKLDGRWHNPYRPKVITECENWKKIGEENGKEEIR